MLNDPLTPPALFKALADDTRARICALLVDSPELCVCELTGALALSQPKISRHLASLRKLFLRYNQLSTLPAEMTALSRLEQLDVSHNRVATLPAQYRFLPALRHVEQKPTELT